MIDKVTADDKQHFGDVTSIILHENILYSSGSDGKIKVKIVFHILETSEFQVKILSDLGRRFKLYKRIEYS